MSLIYSVNSYNFKEDSPNSPDHPYLFLNYDEALDCLYQLVEEITKKQKSPIPCSFIEISSFEADKPTPLLEDFLEKYPNEELFSEGQKAFWYYYKNSNYLKNEVLQLNLYELSKEEYEDLELLTAFIASYLIFDGNFEDLLENIYPAFVLEWLDLSSEDELVAPLETYLVLNEMVKVLVHNYHPLKLNVITKALTDNKKAFEDFAVVRNPKLYS